MKKKRRIQVRRYLKGKISSDTCVCCNKDCLVVVDGLCLKCMKAIISFLKAQFSSRDAGVDVEDDFPVRIRGKIRPTRFSKQELREMGHGSILVKKRKHPRREVEEDEDLEDIPRRRAPKSGFAWTDTE